MIKYLLKINDINICNYGLSEIDLDFIFELILGYGLGENKNYIGFELCIIILIYLNMYNFNRKK